jgi:hypothetical protein
MDVFVHGVMLLLSELIVILLFTVPLNQANRQFLMDDMFQNIEISNIFRTNEMIHTILLLLLFNHPCPTYTLLHLSHLQVKLL